MQAHEGSKFLTLEKPLKDKDTRQTEETDVDVPIELLPLALTGDRIWPRVFPGL